MAINTKKSSLKITGRKPKPTKKKGKGCSKCGK